MEFFLNCVCFIGVDLQIIQCLCVLPAGKWWLVIRQVDHKEIYHVYLSFSITAEGNLAFWAHGFASVSVDFTSGLRNLCVGK